MATFNAAVVGSNLNYDFSKWNGTAGVIPEPSDQMIEQFFDTLKEINGGVESEDLENDPEAAAEALDAVSVTEMQDRMKDAIAELCQGSPSRHQLDNLPPRVRQSFFKWLLQQVQDPELSSAGTKPARARRNGA